MMRMRSSQPTQPLGDDGPARQAWEAGRVAELRFCRFRGCVWDSAAWTRRTALEASLPADLQTNAPGGLSASCKHLLTAPVLGSFEAIRFNDR